MKEPLRSCPDFVEDRALKQRLSDPLRNAAVQLAFHHHRIDDVAEVIDRDVADHGRRPGLRTDLDLRDMTAVRTRRRAAAKNVVDIECRRQAGRQISLSLEPRRKLDEPDGAVRAGDTELSRVELDIRVGSFEQMRRRHASLLDHLRCRLEERGAARHQRA